MEADMEYFVFESCDDNISQFLLHLQVPWLLGLGYLFDNENLLQIKLKVSPILK